MFECSGLYYANLNANEDIVVNQGGTYSGKTYSIDQVLLTKAISEPNRVITIVGESIPNLKTGAMRDAETIVRKSEELKSLIKSWNKTDRIIEFYSGSMIEFKSYLDAQSAHNGKRDYLFINEAPGVSWAICEQLINRTNIRTYIDYNPSYPFWVHEELLSSKRFGKKTVRLIISDHRHNPFLSQEQHDHIEQRAKDNPEWGRVYARGLTGKIEGIIFREFYTCDKIPDGAKFIAYGTDFGFTNDPTSTVAVYEQNGELWIEELLYRTGLTNNDISDEWNRILTNKRSDIICDSAEPKSIEELYRLGWSVYPADKGADSIRNSIDILKRYKMNITSFSVNLLKELRSYKWAEDKEGKPTGKPVDFNNHAIDALRYVALNKLSKSAVSWDLKIL